MNVADRIHTLRKSKGISQEELADRIGVSRQAVSKWESEQSTPDIEKIILLSNFFDVTTDYLLKGIDPQPSPAEAPQSKPSVLVFSIVGTAVNFIGIVTAVMVWIEEQVATATAIGFIFLIVGCMIFCIGMVIGRKDTTRAATHTFIALNVWSLTFIPFSMVFNVLTGNMWYAPLPMEGSLLGCVVFCMVYIAFGVTIDYALYQRAKAARK